MHTVTDPASQNLRAMDYNKQDPHQVVCSCLDDKMDALEDKETPDDVHMPNTHPEVLVGHTFSTLTDNDQLQHVKIVEANVNHPNKDNFEPDVWKFKDIIGHQGPIDSSYKDYKESTYNVGNEWENGEIIDGLFSLSHSHR